MDISATNNTAECTQPCTPESQIAQFYEGKSIFVTGFTGFVGTVMVEKLLFTCRNIKNIYVMIKSKRGKSIEKRLEQIFESKAFERIKQHAPDLLKKIKPIEGNLVENNLGLAEEDIRLLQREVSVVFHVAACIVFTVSLPTILNTNAKATQKLINICKQMPKLTAFVYVSSAYSQSNRAIVDEKSYELEIPVEKVFEIVDVPASESISKNLLENRPNSYTYSKAVSEEVVRSNADQIPVVIVRPTQIISAAKEPVPGWITSWAGPTSIVEAARRFHLFCWHSGTEVVLDAVPVDYVANMIIAAAWDTHNRRIKGEIKKEKEVKIFNYSSGTQNPIGHFKLMKLCLKKHKKLYGSSFFPTNQFFVMTENKFIYFIYFLFLQGFVILISLFIDAFFLLIGRKPRLLKAQKDLAKITSVLKYFTQHQILFSNQNVRRLYERLNETDKDLFNFDITSIKWEDYLEDYIAGMTNYNPKLF